jgi:hypothetical protein
MHEKLADFLGPFRLLTLSPNFKKHLKGEKFLSTEGATVVPDGWFPAQ